MLWSPQIRASLLLMLTSWKIGPISDKGVYIASTVIVSGKLVYITNNYFLYCKLLWFSSRNNPSHIFESSNSFLYLYVVFIIHVRNKSPMRTPRSFIEEYWYPSSATSGNLES